MPVRIATFNLENLDDGVTVQPPLAERIHIMRPQLERIAAEILCLQEIHSQGPPGSRTLAALDQPNQQVHRATATVNTAERFRCHKIDTL